MKSPLLALVTGIGGTWIWFWLTWRYGLDLSDEGYYWYGAQRTAVGEIPMRDFSSYDIGRYYFSAAYMRLTDVYGLLAARVSAALYQCVGTSLGVWLCIHRFSGTEFRRWALAMITAALLTLWVWPYYKVFDHTTSIIVVASVAIMLTRPDRLGWLLAGVGLGIAATMGRNHGAYGVVAATIAALLLLYRGTPLIALIRLSPMFVLGCFVGFAPTIGMAIWIEGFAEAFLESILWIFRLGTTNIPLQVPWPWLFTTSGSGFLLSASQLAPGFGFLFLVVVPIIGVSIILLARRGAFSTERLAIPAAATAAAIPYAHYAFSRADITHLALAIFPAIIATISFSTAWGGMRPFLVSASLLMGSIACLGVSQPFIWSKMFGGKLTEIYIEDHQIFTVPWEVKTIKIAEALHEDYSFKSKNFLATPSLPTLYAMYRARMPIWGIYATIPRDSDFERSEIARLESNKPNLVILSNHALDRREDLRYSQTHPLIYQWISNNYIRADMAGLEAVDLEVYFSK